MSQVVLAPALGIPDETQAIAFFFRHFVLLPRQTDATRGFLATLLPFYNQLGSDSSLHKATTAVALCALANLPGKAYLKGKAVGEYGRAIRKVNDIIISPSTARSDETLLTILLLGLYETISANLRSTGAWSAHVNGAVALAKLRGTEQFKKPVSLNLFRAVRAHMLVNAIQHSLPITDFPAENGWLSDCEQGSTTAQRLMFVTIRLPAIRTRAKQVFADSCLMNSRDTLFELLTLATDVEAAFARWYDSLPSIWSHRTVATLEGMPDNLEEAEVWPGPVNVYEDLVVSNIVNNCRMGRLYCEAVIIACLARLGRSREEVEQSEKYQTALKAAQDIVNAICATVPFHLGYDIKERGRKLGGSKTGMPLLRCRRSPVSSPQHTTKPNHTAAEAVGGYFLLWPLFICARTECVPADQKRWIRGRLKYISRTYGIDGVQYLEHVPDTYLSRGINMVNDPTPDMLPLQSTEAGEMMTPPMPMLGSKFTRSVVLSFSIPPLQQQGPRTKIQAPPLLLSRLSSSSSLPQWIFHGQDVVNWFAFEQTICGVLHTVDSVG
ncbi:MAG: hypothetical protein Q9165_006761 [Trypethelium subeluteriae]